MKAILVWTVAVLAAGLATTAQAQEPSDEHRRLARQLIEIGGLSELESHNQALHQIVAQFQQPETLELWDELTAPIDAKEVIEVLVPIYVKYLSADDMRAALAFYQTPAGRKMIEMMPVIQQQAAIVGRGWGTRVITRLADQASRLPAARTDPQTVLGNVLNRRAQIETLLALRRVGEALSSWLMDQALGNGAGSWPPEREASRDTWWTLGKSSSANLTPSQSFDPIPRDVIVEILVPVYIEALPAEDGWGNALEFAINDELFGATSGISIRSPGRNGTFEKAVYEFGPFDADDYDQDLVWSDGYFHAWPATQREE